jgi:hypothetical protein
MKDNKNDFWACACVKRGRDGVLKAIKLNPPERKRCRVCGCTPLTKAETKS